MVFASALFAVMAISARLAAHSAHWTTLGASRAGVGALVAFAVARARGASLRTKAPKLSWARSLLGTLSMLTTFYALGQAELAIGDASVLFATSPLFIALLSPRMLGERPDKRLWGLILVAFVGVALVAGPHFSFRGLPALSALVSALFSALAMMFLRKMRAGTDGNAPESAEAIAFHFAVVGFSVFFLLNLVTYRRPEPADIGYLICAGVAGGLAQLAMTRAYAMTEAARLGAISYVGTVLSLVAAVVVLHERPSAQQLAGSALVIVAGAAVALVAARR